jgi:clan AA aspartic protease
MIIGRITNNQEAIIELEIVGLNQREKIEVVIDTGFDGHLTLPGDLINRIGLRQAGRRYAILGDGNIVALELYRAKVLWHGEEREVPILRTDGGPLVGMALLNGNRVILDVVTDGDVRIDILS